MIALRAFVVLAFSSALGACALLGPGSLDETGPGVMPAGAAAAANAASSALALAAPGRTKAEVSTAVGPANAVRFESGWEVWVYRWLGTDHSARAATELVVLFDASGVVRKSRVRGGYER